MEINRVQAKESRLWTDSAPERVDVRAVALPRLRQLRIWNTWKTRYGAEDAWTGNFGMLVDSDDGGLSFRCSDGLGEAEFADFTFRIETAPS